MNKYQNIILWCLILLFSGCIKEDINKISEVIIWEPDISGPVFEDTFYTSETRIPGNIQAVYPDLSYDYLPISKDFDMSFDELFKETNYINFHTEDIQQLWFMLYVENSFPSKLQVYIDFMKEPNDYIKTLEIDPPIIIPEPQINSNGEVIKRSTFSQLIPIDHTDPDIIEETDFIRVEIRLFERQISPEILLNINNYFCTCNIGLRAQLKVFLND